MPRCVDSSIAAVLCLAGAGSVAAQSRNKRSDPEQIGSRDVGSGINFYSLEKEIALGKQIAQGVERSWSQHWSRPNT